MVILAFEINAALVRRLISRQFPQWAGLGIEAVDLGGWDNRTFHLGDKMSVRLPNGEAYAAQVDKEQNWLPVFAPKLPLLIPTPLAMGKPDEGYPWNWSVYKWLGGENASLENIDNLEQFAASLAEFLLALQSIDASNGPKAGRHNFFRGGNLAIYDLETRQAMKMLKEKIELDFDLVSKVWIEALNSKWESKNLWVHGDLSAANILINQGEISAVIDFGCLGVGDPACDLVIAWTFLSRESRKVFCDNLSLDKDTRARARGWAVWKSLITIVKYMQVDKNKTQKAKDVLQEVLIDYQNFA